MKTATFTALSFLVLITSASAQTAAPAKPADPAAGPMAVGT